MKKMFFIVVSILMVLSLAACNGNSDSSVNGNTENTSNTNESSTKSQSDNNGANSKVLVAYFSATGTTKKIAQYATNAMGADLYEIAPTDPYTSDDLNYNNKNSRSTIEMNDENSRPKISTKVENMEDYDIVFIGYPIWWGKTPKIVSTFVESYDFSGKTVVTFSTSGSSGHDDSSIKSLVKGANWITGNRFGSSASQSDVADWIGDLGLDITLNK